MSVCPSCDEEGPPFSHHRFEFVEDHLPVPEGKGSSVLRITCENAKFETLTLGVLLRAPDGWEHVGEPRFLLELADQPEMVAVKYTVRRPLRV